MTTIGIVGLGLIGGSVALAARRAGYPVVAWDADAQTRDQAAAGQGLTVSADLTAADIIVLAVPMPALTDGLRTTLAGVELSAAATITDVGSLKQPVAAAIRTAGLAERYVGGHPMAGTERSGFAAAIADLFTGARWALCLDDDDGDRHIGRWLQIAAVLTDLGAGVLAVTPAEHDAAMAMVSGVPHLFALALSASAEMSGPLSRTLAAGSFADLTRVAGSNPTLLHAITQRNEPAVRAALRLVLDQLDRPWGDLIEAGHVARESLQGNVLAGSSFGRTQLSVPGGRELLELGRDGVVIETVDADAGVIGYRTPTRS